MTEAMDLAKTLDELSKAATQGEWDWDAGVIPPDGPGHYSDIYIIDEDREPLTIAEFNDSIPQGRDNAKFIVALVAAYRTGKLVVVPDDAVERMAVGLAMADSCTRPEQFHDDDYTLESERLLYREQATAALAALKGADHAG